MGSNSGSFSYFVWVLSGWESPSHSLVSQTSIRIMEVWAAWPLTSSLVFTISHFVNMTRKHSFKKEVKEIVLFTIPKLEKVNSCHISDCLNPIVPGNKVSVFIKRSLKDPSLKV